MRPDALIADLRARKPPAIARAISIVENGRDGFEAILSAIHPGLGHARRIGITGPPGAGKSSLIAYLARNGAQFYADDVVPLRFSRRAVRAWPA